MKRSLWKLPFIHSTFFKKSKKNLNLKKIFLRNSLIPYNSLNKRVLVYNGHWFLGVAISKFMMGHKFGEFSFTKIYDGQSQIRRKTKKKLNQKKNKLVLWPI